MHNHEVHLQISDYLPGYIIISNPVRFYSKFASQHLRIQSSIQGNMQISHIISHIYFTVTIVVHIFHNLLLYIGLLEGLMMDKDFVRNITRE